MIKKLNGKKEIKQNLKLKQKNKNKKKKNNKQKKKRNKKLIQKDYKKNNQIKIIVVIKMKCYSFRNNSKNQT